MSLNIIVIVQCNDIIVDSYICWNEMCTNIKDITNMDYAQFFGPEDT